MKTRFATCKVCEHAHSSREPHVLIGGPAPSKSVRDLAAVASVTVATGPMTHAEAVALTERIRRTQDDWCRLVYEAHEREAWRAMGYKGWLEYVYAELPMSRSRAYQLLTRAKIALAIGAGENFHNVELPPEGQIRKLTKPARERVLEAAGPEQAREQLTVEIAAVSESCAHVRRVTMCEDCGRRL